MQWQRHPRAASSLPVQQKGARRVRLVRGNALINEIDAMRLARAAGQLSLVEAIDEVREPEAADQDQVV